MNPGRKLDALVAEKVFGLKPVVTPNGFLVGYSPAYNIGASPLKPYSTDISAAWEVVDKIPMTISAPDAPMAYGEYKYGPDYDNKELIWAAEAKIVKSDMWSDIVVVYGLTAPHAICLAALKAVGHNV